MPRKYKKKPTKAELKKLEEKRARLEADLAEIRSYQYDQKSRLQQLKDLPAYRRAKFMKGISEEQMIEMAYDPEWICRPKQLEAIHSTAKVTVICAGRSWGKTKSGASTVVKYAEENPNCKIGLFGCTASEVRDVMVAGIIDAAHPDRKPHYIASTKSLTFPNGSVCLLYSMTEPDSCGVGQNLELSWIDELGKAPKQDMAFKQINLATRKGKHGGKIVITTTPRPTALIRKLKDDPSVKWITGVSYENYTISEKFFLEVIKERGDLFYRQDVLAEILTATAGALFEYDWINENRVESFDHTKCDHLFVSIDPAGSVSKEADNTGIIVGGVLAHGEGASRGYVFEDATCKSSPEEYAKKAIQLYYKYGCKAIIIESNFGALMGKTILNQVDPEVPVIEVRAKTGKHSRAQPIALMYQQGRITHVGHKLNELETQMIQYDPLTSKRSPDRMDALVWLFTHALLAKKKSVWAF